MITVKEDTYVTQVGNAESSNYGSGTYLQLGMPESTYSYDTSFIYFKLDGINKRKIRKITLKLYAFMGRGSGSIMVSIPNSTWKANTITWDNKPAAYANYSVVPAGKDTIGWWTFDITNTVQRSISDNMLERGFFITWSSTAAYNRSGYRFYSTRGSAANAPIIEVEYEATHLVESESTYYTFNGSNWEEVSMETGLNNEVFEQSGISEMQSIAMSKWDELKRPVRIHTLPGDGDKGYTVNHGTRKTKRTYMRIETLSLFSPESRIGSQYSLVSRDKSSVLMSVPEYKLLDMFGEISVLRWTLEPDNAIIAERASSTNRLKYMISKNKIDWYGNNGSEWIENYEMESEELNSLTESQYGEFFGDEVYSEDFYLKYAVYSEDPITPTATRAIEVSFVENKPPIILTPSLSPESIQANLAKLTATVRDQEGDTFEFRVLIKKGTGLFEEVKPWTKMANNGQIEEEYNYKYFALGANQVKLEVKDQRGAVSQWTGNLTMTNQAPFMVYSNSNHWIKGTIGDSDTADEVTYRIFINNELVLDYLEYAPAPRAFSYTFKRSAMKIGQINEIRIEVKDLIGSTYTHSFQVIGVYKGLMFIDENNYYYTDEKKGLLQWLDFGTIKGGEVSEIKKVYLENRCGFPVNDLTIKAEDVVSSLFPEEGEDIWSLSKIVVEISATENPFIPSKEIRLDGVLADSEKKEFYLRIVTDREVRESGEFKAVARGKAII